MDLFVEIVFVLCTLILIAVVLLQAGRGGGLGTALGGGASQGVFGGGGGADFLAKLTQALAATFMICSVYLAYASTHTGSERLRKMSEELESEKHLAGEDDEIDYERVGPNPLPLPDADAEPETLSEVSDDAETPEPTETPTETPATEVTTPADAPAEAEVEGVAAEDEPDEADEPEPDDGANDEPADEVEPDDDAPTEAEMADETPAADDQPAP